MKKGIITILCIVLILMTALSFSGCYADHIICYTNAFFAPFEYYDGIEIVGVDIDIMRMVAKRLGKQITFENKEFGTLINYVESGKLCDCSAAGFTITEERLEKVNFSIPYYTSTQYVVARKNRVQTFTNLDGEDCVLWEKLRDMKIGVQLDTTGHIYVEGEISGWDGEAKGILQGSDAECVEYDEAQLAFSALKVGQIDLLVVDHLPASYLTKNAGDEYIAYPLYYDETTATVEEYGIAVNKNNTVLLETINQVLTELMSQVNEHGENGIDLLVKSHYGI